MLMNKLEKIKLETRLPTLTQFETEKKKTRLFNFNFRVSNLEGFESYLKSFLVLNECQ